jgi:hypothetical protein
VRSLSWVARVYVGIVVGAGVSVILLGPFTGIAWRELAVLAVLFLICDSAPASIKPRRLAWSASSSAILAAVVLLGPVGAAIVGMITAFSMRSLLLVQRAFNSCMYALSAYVAGWVCLPPIHSPVSSFPSQLPR